jgi:hypothetical protein
MSSVRRSCAWRGFGGVAPGADQAWFALCSPPGADQPIFIGGVTIILMIFAEVSAISR